MNTRKAFTLIELLVVIAIIAILAAILFPVFAQAKLAAKKAVTTSNMKQATLGLLMYAGDSDDQFPMAEYGDDYSSATPHITWTTEVYPYVKNGDRGIDATAGNTVTTGKSGVFVDVVAPQRPLNNSAVEGYSFGVNRLICADDFNGGESWFDGAGQVVPSMSTSGVDAPADRIVMASKGMNYYDSTNTWSYPWFCDWQTQYIDSIATTPGDPSTVYRDGDTSWNPNSPVYSPNIDTDCNVNSSGAWECAAHPRYRYSYHTVVSYTDGHVKALGRGQIQWWHNIYVPRAGIGSDNWTYGWYYPYEPY